MITTIKIHESTKSRLDMYKMKKESYDEIIDKIVSKLEDKELSDKLIHAYSAISQSEFKEFKEWERIDL